MIKLYKKKLICALGEHFRRYAHALRFAIGLLSTSYILHGTQKFHQIVKYKPYQISSGPQASLLTHCSEKLRETTYFSLVRSFLEYSATVWHPRRKYNSDKLEMVQRRAAHFVKGRYVFNGIFESVTQMLEQHTAYMDAAIKAKTVVSFSFTIIWWFTLTTNEKMVKGQ